MNASDNQPADAGDFAVAPPAARSRGLSISMLLLSLVVVSILPLTAILAYLTYRDAMEDSIAQGKTLQALAKSTAGEVARLLGQIDRMSSVLAQQPMIRRLDPHRCDPLLAHYQRLFPNIANITTVDRSGMVVCSAVDRSDDEFKVPLTAGPSVAGTKWFTGAIAAHGLTIGDPTIGVVTGIPVSVISVPIAFEDTDSTGLIAVSLNLGTYDPNRTVAGLPPGTRSGIVRGDGTLIWTSATARPAPPAEPPVPESVLTSLLTTGSGTLEFQPTDDWRWTFAIAPVGYGDLYAFVGVPRPTYFLGAGGSPLRNLVLGLVAVLLASLLAAHISRRIATPIKRLAEATQRLRRGEKSARAPEVGSLETTLVANSFNNLVDTWQDAERRAAQAAERAEDLYQNAPCGYHSLDAGGTYRFINDTELRWLGYSRDEVVGRMTIYDVLSPTYGARFKRLFEELRITGSMSNLPTEYRAKDGTVIPVLVAATTVKDADGNFVMTRSVVHDVRERRKFEQERDANARQIRQLSRKLISVQEEERRRLSSELHDRVSADLAALATDLKAIEKRLPPAVLEDLGEVIVDSRAVLDDASRGLREVCAALRPAVLDYAGLVPAIQSYARQFSKRSGIAVTFDAPENTPRYAGEIESALFRIVQEALTNCVKYAAGAQHVTISIRVGQDRNTLTIADDGVGFDVSAVERGDVAAGLGLLSMRWRAEFIDGELEVDSAPDAGTTVRVYFPNSIDSLNANPAVQA